MDKGAWRATVRGLAKSQTQLSTHAHVCLCVFTVHPHYLQILYL